MTAHQRPGGAKVRRWGLVLVLGALVAATAFVLGARFGDGGSDDDGVAVPAGASAAPAPGGGQEFDGCGLVHELEAREILRGRVLPAAKPVEGPAAATCAWEVPDGDNPRSLQLSVYRGHELFAPEGFEDDPTFEEVEGVGDRAFLVAGSSVQLHFLTGDYSALISVGAFEGEEPLDRETVEDQLVELAGRVVSRL